MSTFLLVGGMAFLTLIGAFGAYFFKLASKKSVHPFRIWKNYYFILAGFLYVVATIGYIYLLQGRNLTILYPLASLQYAWIALLGWLLLRETISQKKMLGIGLIIIGVSLVVL